MVSSVTSAPYFSYLNQLTGTSAGTSNSIDTTSSTTAMPTVSSVTPSASTAATNSSSLVSSLLGGSSTSAFSSEILSLLQPDSAGNFDPITTLLGGTGTNDALSSEYANLFASSASASLQQAQTQGTTKQSQSDASATTASPISNLVNALTQASVAYNNTLQQNAQNVINANSYQANGVTPLVVSS